MAGIRLSVRFGYTVPVRVVSAVAVLVLGSFVVVGAAAYVPPEVGPLVDLVINDRPSIEELRSAAAEAAVSVSRVEDPADRLRLEAIVEFLVGFGELGMGLRNEAEGSFQHAARPAEKANRLRETSDGQRVLADALNQLLELRGTGYRILNAPRARAAAFRAVELDPANPFAHIAVAAFLASAPRVAGGDPQAALRHLQVAGSLTADRLARFLIAVWRARVFAAPAAPAGGGGSPPAGGVVEAVEQAHAIFPRNWWLAEVAAGLGVELPE